MIEIILLKSKHLIAKLLFTILSFHELVIIDDIISILVFYGVEAALLLY